MGGAQAGEVASKIAIEVFEQGLSDSGNPEERLAQRAREANRKIHERSLTEHGREGMGTTVTAVWLGDAQASIAHVGDSRAYLFRDGELRRLTQDHTLVDELVRRGKLTAEQAAEHPQRSIITRALGPEPSVDVDTLTYAVKSGDVLLLCSDGLTAMVSEERVAEILASASTLDQAASQLIEDANQAGGRDNITVVAARLEDTDEEARPEEATMISRAGDRSTDAPPRPPSASEPGGGRGRPAVPHASPAAPSGRRPRISPSSPPQQAGGDRAHRGYRPVPDRGRRLPRQPAAVLDRYQQPGDRHDLSWISLQRASSWAGTCMRATTSRASPRRSCPRIGARRSSICDFALRPMPQSSFAS